MKYKVGKTYRIVSSNFLFSSAFGVGAVGDTFTVDHVDSNGSACDKNNNPLAYLTELKKGYVVLVEDEPERRWPYKINPDGSVTRNGCTITAEEAENIAALSPQIDSLVSLPVRGHKVTVSRPIGFITIDDQKISGDELEAFIKEYQSGEWKEQDVMVQLGDRVQNQYGVLYIVAELGDTVGLINLKTGTIWSRKNLPPFYGAEEYSLTAVSGKTGNFKLIKE